MASVDKIYNAFCSNGADFFTGVPDSLLNSICAYITDVAPREKHIIAANEGTAIGIASGYYMASGKLPIVYMQNSGLGNTVNPLLSLADKKVYSLPLILMVGWRGEPGIKDEPQHIKQGEVTLDLLNAMSIPYTILDFDNNEAVSQIHDIIVSTKKHSSPHAIIIRQNTFEQYKLQHEVENVYPLSREKALKLIIDYIGSTDIIVSTTGKLSRELFEYRVSKEQGHERDFLTVGSMGYSSAIALGIAIEKPDRQVYCLDGDGAFLMHMGAISNIGDISSTNFRHIVFNNGAHESVGGQPTLGFKIDIPAIAKACGYKYAITVSNEKEIDQIMKNISQTEGPILIEVRVRIESRSNLGRPTTTPIENKEQFMNFLSIHE